MARLVKAGGTIPLRRAMSRYGSTTSKGGFFSEGTQEKVPGLLFGETPAPAGQARKWESWEAPWYTTLTLATVMLTVGLSSKPDRNIVSWAKDEAQKRRSTE